MYTIGTDFHKRTSSLYVLDGSGELVSRVRLENDPEKLLSYINGIAGPKRIAMEATRNWGLFYDLVSPHVDGIELAHPKKLKLIAKSETKNDMSDAEILARLAQSNFLPLAHASGLDIRELRSLVRFRGFLVNQRRSIRNQVQTLIDRNIWPCERPKSFQDLFCDKGLKWLSEVELPKRERVILNQCLELFAEQSERITTVEKVIAEQAPELPDLKYLRTVPGFRTSKVNAFVVLVEASDINRFRKARGFAHYSGLIPQERSSGDKHRTGGLVKGANMHLRTAFIESTLAAIRTDRGLAQYYQQVKDRKGAGAAIVATARKLSYAVYHVLKEKRNYRPEPFKAPVANCHPIPTSSKKK